MSKTIECPNCYTEYIIEKKDNSDRKVAFVIGHYELDKGAYSTILGVSEWNYWNLFYDKYLKHLGDRFIHSNKSNYTQRQKLTSELTKDYDLVFELHFNSSAPEAHGVEALVYFGNEKMQKVGQYYCDLMEDYGLRNRNVKPTTGGNGYGFLKATVGDAILLEPFFGSNKEDCETYSDENHYDVIKKTIDYYYSL